MPTQYSQSGPNAGGGIDQAAVDSTVAVHAATPHPTANEKAALAGTSGTAPSVTNKIVDNADTRMTNSRTPTTHGADKHSQTLVETSDSRLSDARTPLSHGADKHSQTLVETGDSRLADARTPLSHGADKHSQTLVETGDSRLSDARTPVSHGADKHSQTLVETGDSRLSDERAPLSHGADKHSQTLVETGDSRLSDARTPTSHGADKHSQTLVETGDARLSDARTPTAHTHPGSDLSTPVLIPLSPQVGEVALTMTDMWGKCLTWAADGIGNLPAIAEADTGKSGTIKSVGGVITLSRNGTNTIYSLLSETSVVLTAGVAIDWIADYNGGSPRWLIIRSYGG
jgi:hypothetical protein